ncbi:hypothetical protein [Embleya sp. NPDC050493]|uniref:hypothetical protein n=1 Tax=Embleya sp. NPDC050493 TaxID=3363989 RepID=UPI0037B41EBB
MQVADMDGLAWPVTVPALLCRAERACLRADFADIRPLLRRIEHDFGIPSDSHAATRYAVLRSAVAARVGNWAEAVRWCPDRGSLERAETGVVHTVALAALRRLCETEGRSEPGTAALTIVLWAYLLDDDDPGGFRALLTTRRGTAVADDHWDEARCRLVKRITDLLHALDTRAGRDALAAWETAWAAERLAPVLASGTGSDSLIPLECAARYLVGHGQGLALLEAYSARHPNPDTWSADSVDDHACADALARALSQRGQDRAQTGEWGDALADFATAARLGHSLGPGDQAAVRRAWKNVGRTLNGYGYSTIVRIHGLETAYPLLPGDSELAAELTAELVRQGQKVFDSDTEQSRKRFARALSVSPGDKEARAGLDDHLRVDLCRTFDGAQPDGKLGVREVRDLLRRDPECAFARRWLGDHYAEKAVTAAVRGLTAQARAAIRKMLHYDDHAGPYDEEFVDEKLVELLLGEAEHAADKGTRAGAKRRVKLLNAVADVADRLRVDVGEEPTGQETLF